MLLIITRNFNLVPTVTFTDMESLIENIYAATIIMRSEALSREK